MKVSLFEDKLEFVKISDKVTFRFAQENPCKRELHWFKTVNGRRSINCAGNGCPFCKAGIPKLTRYLFIVYEHMSGEVKILELPTQVISTLTSIIKNIGYEAAIKKDFVLTRKKNSNPYYTLVTLDRPVGDEEVIQASFKKWFSKYTIDDVDKLTTPPSLELAYKVFKEQVDKSSLDYDVEDDITSLIKQNKSEAQTPNTKEQKNLDDIFDDDEEVEKQKTEKKIKSEETDSVVQNKTVKKQQLEDDDEEEVEAPKKVNKKPQLDDDEEVETPKKVNKKPQLDDDEEVEVPKKANKKLQLDDEDDFVPKKASKKVKDEDEDDEEDKYSWLDD